MIERDVVIRVVLENLQFFIFDEKDYGFDENNRERRVVVHDIKLETEIIRHSHERQIVSHHTSSSWTGGREAKEEIMMRERKCFTRHDWSAHIVQCNDVNRVVVEKLPMGSWSWLRDFLLSHEWGHYMMIFIIKWWNEFSRPFLFMQCK